MSFSFNIRTLPAGLFAVAAMMGASSASAQAGAASVQISGKAHEINQGPDSPLGKGDTEFSQLFASWESLDNGGGVVAPVRAAVSVPSRMPLEKMTLTSGYGMRNHPILRKRQGHKGVDLAAPRGTPVYATADGLVGKAQWFSSYGKYIQIEHGGEMQTRYAHLSRYVVAAGDRVHKGDLIGYVGSTGRSTGPHLHYEVRIASKAVNPIPYMTGQIAHAANHDATAMGGPE